MPFDLDLIKQLYAALPERVKAARKLAGRPLTLSEKSYMPTFLRRCPKPNLNAQRIMSILLQTGLPCRMQLPKWHCCNL